MCGRPVGGEPESNPVRCFDASVRSFLCWPSALRWDWLPPSWAPSRVPGTPRHETARTRLGKRNRGRGVPPDTTGFRSDVRPGRYRPQTVRDGTAYRRFAPDLVPRIVPLIPGPTTGSRLSLAADILVRLITTWRGPMRRLFLGPRPAAHAACGVYLHRRGYAQCAASRRCRLVGHLACGGDGARRYHDDDRRGGAV